MRVYWTLKSIPELSALPFWERGRSWRAAFRESRCLSNWRYWASITPIIALGGIGGLVAYGCFLFLYPFIGDLAFGTLLLELAGVVVGALWHAKVLVELVRPNIRKRLVDIA